MPTVCSSFRPSLPRFSHRVITLFWCFLRFFAPPPPSSILSLVSRPWALVLRMMTRSRWGVGSCGLWLLVTITLSLSLSLSLASSRPIPYPLSPISPLTPLSSLRTFTGSLSPLPPTLHPPLYYRPPSRPRPVIVLSCHPRGLSSLQP